MGAVLLHQINSKPGLLLRRSFGAVLALRRQGADAGGRQLGLLVFGGSSAFLGGAFLSDPRTTSGGGPWARFPGLRPAFATVRSPSPRRLGGRRLGRRPRGGLGRLSRCGRGRRRRDAGSAGLAREPRQQAPQSLSKNYLHQTTTPSPRRPRARVVDPADLTEARARRLLFPPLPGRRGRLFQDRRLWSLSTPGLLLKVDEKGSGKSSSPETSPGARVHDLPPR